MVLGLRSKNHRKGSLVQVDYVVHVQEITPWPPSKSLKSVESVLLQWGNGDQISGLFTSGVGDGKIEFDESFRLPVSLCRDGKSKARESFQKNCLEFHLYESRKDKAVKGQLLGSAVVNIAEYGIVKEIASIYAPLNCKRSFRSMAQPVLFVKVQPFDKDVSQTAAELMSEENYEETEIASITDDDDDCDIPSHSSRTSSSSAYEATGGVLSRKEENVPESTKNGAARSALHMIPVARNVKVNTGADAVHLNGSLSPLSSIQLSSDHGSHVYDHASLSEFPERNLMPIREKSATYCIKSSSPSLGYRDNNEESDACTKGFAQESMAYKVHKKVDDESIRIQEIVMDKFADKDVSSETYFQVGVDSNYVRFADSKHCDMDHTKARGMIQEQILEEKLPSHKELVSQTPEDATKKQISLRSDTLPLTRRVVGVQGSNVTSNRLQHAKSVQFPSDSANIKRFIGNNKVMDKTKVVDTQEDADNTFTSYSTSEGKETVHGFDASEVELESRVEMLEEELREAAAIEIGLYSVVAEHGSSINKVHAPARRLSRFYLHACKAESQAKQASAARAAVSGLVLVSKACGNDVPRLAFWLSNSIALRAIISKAVEELPISAGSCIKSNGGGKEANKKIPLKRNKLSPNEEGQYSSLGSSDDWEDPQMFIVALEKIEAWIFSRILESVWWQTLTPHMQSAAAKDGSKKTNVRRYGLGDQGQGNFSIDLWKKAFEDTCERLCPVRAGGHECGCLSVLARLVMEQLVDRLDVAMFNAILRESAEEMPTDPVSDPISDSRVLPIPAGKSSFGAGAQLKNAVGNWSRWLTDLFGIDDDSPEDENNLDIDKRPEGETSFKAFHLLNALSDLMMLPLEMLTDRSTRNEVCPTFGLSLIKRVLNNFVPDEFCPEPIPESVLEALDSEDSHETVGESISSFPVSATPPVYSTPPAASLAGVMGEVGSQALSRSGSSVLKKSCTSDDELDELDSPISSIISGNSMVSANSTGPDWMPKTKGGRKVVRYKLLQEVWTMERS